MPATLSYETKTCGRCGGSGHYSYCEMYGTTCFGCRGTGKVLSAAGKRAHAAVEAFKAEHFSMLAESIKPGDRIKVSGMRRAATVATVTTDDGARFGSKGPDGEMVWTNYVTVTFTNAKLGSYGLIPGTKVLKAIGGADWETVVAFAKTLKGAVVTEAVSA